MHNHKWFYSGNSVSPLSCQVGGVYSSAPIPPTIPLGARPLGPLNRVELQPFDVCPKNFIIFDRTENRSRIMYNPTLEEESKYHDFRIDDNYMVKDTGTENREFSYPTKEDTRDIDALLSLDDEEDEDEMSTARTLGRGGSNSTDSYSNYGSIPSKRRLSSSVRLSSSCSSSTSERNHLKMKKTMKMLRGIVPGADQMNSATVLDEAVKYLKCLKVEAKKLGIGNFQD